MGRTSTSSKEGSEAVLPFGIGFSEVLLIMVVVLLVVGPAKLPEMARTLGKGMRALRRAGDELRDAVQVEEIRRTMYEEPVQAWRDATRAAVVEPEDSSPKDHPYADIDAAEAKAHAGHTDNADIEDAEVEPVAPPAAEPPDEAPPKLTTPPDTVARGSAVELTEDDEPADT